MQIYVTSFKHRVLYVINCFSPDFLNLKIKINAEHIITFSIKKKFRKPSQSSMDPDKGKGITFKPLPLNSLV